MSLQLRASADFSYMLARCRRRQGPISDDEYAICTSEKRTWCHAMHADTRRWGISSGRRVRGRCLQHLICGYPFILRTELSGPTEHYINSCCWCNVRETSGGRERTTGLKRIYSSRVNSHSKTTHGPLLKITPGKKNSVSHAFKFHISLVQIIDWRRFFFCAAFMFYCYSVK